jgi:hypothetical protein
MKNIVAITSIIPPARSAKTKSTNWLWMFSKATCRERGEIVAFGVHGETMKGRVGGW